ncbi:MAG: hypothetical protein JO356_07370 [Acidobacteria bacterium]|nr:hypothetical protein [Acidobacteriota bacterium]
MAELIDALLNLSRMASSTVNPERVDLSAISRSIMETWSALRRSVKWNLLLPQKKRYSAIPGFYV